MHPYKLIEQGIKHPTISTNNNLLQASPRSQMLWFFSVNYVINSGVQPAGFSGSNFRQFSWPSFKHGSSLGPENSAAMHVCPVRLSYWWCFKKYPAIIWHLQSFQSPPNSVYHILPFQHWILALEHQDMSADTTKLTGPRKFADKRWVGPVKLLCIIMFNISKIRPKSLLGQVKAQKSL